jgi:hypothetical protein
MVAGGCRDVGVQEGLDDVGYDEFFLPEPLQIDEFRDDPDPGTVVAVAAYDAVRAGVPLFRELLATGSEPAVRCAAAYLPCRASGMVTSTAVRAGGP